jgi:hypothetical protein
MGRGKGRECGVNSCRHRYLYILFEYSVMFTRVLGVGDGGPSYLLAARLYP